MACMFDQVPLGLLESLRDPAATSAVVVCLIPADLGMIGHWEGRTPGEFPPNPGRVAVVGRRRARSLSEW